MSPPGRPRLLIAHEQEVIRAGILACVRSSRRATVIAATGESDRALEQAQELHPDVALVSGALRSISGEPLLHALRRTSPETRLVAIVRALSLQEVTDALRTGAVGVVDEGARADVLIDSILAAGSSGSLLTGPTASVLLDRLEPRSRLRLTTRQRQVLGMLASSLGTAEIAGRLGIRPATVRLHVRHILMRLGASTRTQAVSLAVRLGLVRLG
jgi:DNA-binding NarL/FixJ family response regulator